ncbi:protein phosphatase 2C 51-like, partial [Salvia hispanica]|uniref:protein phosphatase 2C 51-like n=1 Tax=Salvia hispanica TaxID=49212 RepID=UPI0020097338
MDMNFDELRQGSMAPECESGELAKPKNFCRKRMDPRRIKSVSSRKRRSDVRKEIESMEGAVLIRHGAVSIIGRRREMEDAVAAEVDFLQRGGRRYSFFGVYDGHGGWRVARDCSERLHKVLAEIVEGDVGEEIAWERVMAVGFRKMDEEVNKSGALVASTGSTAVVAVVGEEEVVVANCGDSRAVLSRGGVAVQISDDHKPDRPDE